ncbi:MAG TPA: ATP synthase F1 subunit delta [Candidatus Eisenbacteria bacterium]
MSQDASIAGRYARALLLLTQRQVARSGAPLVAALERTLDELQTLAQLTAPGSSLGNFLLDPEISPVDRRRVLETGLKGRAMPSVQVFADLLLRKKRIGITGAIAREFKAIVERAKGLERATVVSAVPLHQAELTRLHGELERVTGKKIVLETRIETALLGGAYVRIGDRVVDRSVKTLLESIANQLYETSV